MNDYNPKNWFALIFSFHRSDTLRILWKQMVYIGILTALITALKLHFFPDSDVLKNLTSIYSLLGFVISLLLVFRTNTAYDRWWEGRKMWGSLVNDSRNLGSILFSLKISDQEKEYYRSGIYAFCLSMKDHLRGHKKVNSGVWTVPSEIDHPPLWIMHQLRREIQRMLEKGSIDAQQWKQISSHLDHMTDSLGACERIRNTPIPYS
ncbi:MAG: hypothetical protein RL110_391, partial [Bacteroidota bacterium]